MRGASEGPKQNNYALMYTKAGSLKAAIRDFKEIGTVNNRKVITKDGVRYKMRRDAKNAGCGISDQDKNKSTYAAQAIGPKREISDLNRKNVLCSEDEGAAQLAFTHNAKIR